LRIHARGTIMHGIMSSIVNRLPRSTPESRGISSSVLENYLRRADAELGGMHSFMLVRGGAVVAEAWWAPYAAHRPHALFSLSKSFTSTAVGLAVAEGKLTVDDRVISFFPEALPSAVSDNLAAMRVRDLLAMATGHAVDTLDALFFEPQGDWARAFLSRPVEHAPGAPFVYNSGATYMLSAIVQRVTGQRISEYLTPRLFEPLGIANPMWDRDPRGVDVGGWGLNITTEDIACFGQMFLQNGAWNGRQIVSREWVAEATRMHSDNSMREVPDWQQGYGYQFWRCRHGAYRGDGAFGQLCVVLPAQDAVIAVTACVSDMQRELDLIWDVLLPAFEAQPLAPNLAAHAALMATAGALGAARPNGSRTSPIAARISGRRFALTVDGGAAPIPPELAMNISGLPLSVGGSLNRPADALQVDVADDGVVLHLHTARGVDRIAASFDDWRESTVAFTTDRPMLSAGAAAWLDDHTLQVTACFCESPFARAHVLRFDADGAHVEIESIMNAVFGPNENVRARGSLS
jgi:CubicO group peptidase (beta-lactamase class C family)